MSSLVATCPIVLCMRYLLSTLLKHFVEIEALCHVACWTVTLDCITDEIQRKENQNTQQMLKLKFKTKTTEEVYNTLDTTPLHI